ncbi:MAG: hypothetical protein RJA61_129 [Candidatus Parcubacteria bacterium]|jgi:signal transduction histidine kinase
MSLFSISSAITFFASLYFALSVYLSNKNSKINKLWLFFSMTIGGWSIALFFVTSAETEKNALLGQYFLDLFAVFVPLLYYYFVSEFIGYKNKILNISLSILALAFAVFSFSPLFKQGVAVTFDFFWIKPGMLYFLFPIYFGFFVILSLFLLIRKYTEEKKKPYSILKTQILVQIIAAAIGFGGGITNFLPQLFDLYPFGNYFIILYLFIITFGVLKYKFLSPKVISAQIFSGAITIVFLFNLLQQSENLTQWLIKFLIFVLVVFFAILLTRGVYKEVEQREQIEKLAKELEKANDQQVNLIHFITHQVKGFFTISRNIFSSLIDGDYGVLPSSAKILIEEGLKSDTKAVETVQQILHASDVKKGTVEYAKKDFDLKTLITEEFEKEKMNAEIKKINLTLTIDPGEYILNGDKDQFVHVAHNLMDNSIKYTPKGTVAVTLKKEGKEIIFKIKDTGIGITPEDMKNLFKEGGRGKESVKVNTDSTGYGLFIVKGIVEAHGGTVTAHSLGKDKGSEFVVKIPILK